MILSAIKKRMEMIVTLKTFNAQEVILNTTKRMNSFFFTKKEWKKTGA
ncbi:hypothetical protein LNTAR_17908 [Lentisphaera araneosa HTCC2155]|jgi:hypothetical protein|uniref:Uncharacterized protein n=1 Tax=Lentisphaera araneosa HTCC2155 TaxID=313628 RepID=A6DFS0_9BACT|nr:hypothetical protein LNTAR_17908 [Lentisphaera araneosa HTCC2155]